MKKTAFRHLLQCLDLSPEKAAERIGLPCTELEALLDEYVIHKGKADNWKPGDGIPRPVARLIALRLDVHRALLENPDWDKMPLQLNMHYNEQIGINGIYGRICFGVDPLSTEKFPIHDNDAQKWNSVKPDQFIGFITNGLHAVIVNSAKISNFTLETSKGWGKRVKLPNEIFNPQSGINPELLLGTFEIIEFCQKSGIFEINKSSDIFEIPDLKNRLTPEMKPEYIDELYGFIKASQQGSSMFLEGMHKVTIRFVNGCGHAYEIPAGHDPALSEFYRAVRTGTAEPGILMLKEPDCITGIHTDQIVNIYFPWAMIAADGAHLDLVSKNHDITGDIA